MEIATRKEINVQQTVDWPRIKGTHSSASENIELSGRSGKTWFSEA
jgi:streptogramin lyase